MIKYTIIAPFIKEGVYLGKMINTCEIFIYAGIVLFPSDIKTKTSEKVEIFRIHDAITHPKIINNLRYIIPKCIAVLDGFNENNAGL